jgi:hypothetical protein
MFGTECIKIYKRELYLLSHKPESIVEENKNIYFYWLDPYTFSVVP